MKNSSWHPKTSYCKWKQYQQYDSNMVNSCLLFPLKNTKKSENLHSDALLVFLKVIKISKEQTIYIVTIYNIWYNLKIQKGKRLQSILHTDQGMEENFATAHVKYFCLTLFQNLNSSGVRKVADAV